MRSAKLAMAATAMILLLGLAGCGGGGGGDSGTAAATTTTTTNGTGGTTTTPTALVGVFVDAAVDGLLYSAQPSGLSGTTGNGGQYKYQPGDTVTFSIPNGGNPIVIGTRVHGTGTVATNTFVSALPNGQQVAELLHALNHGSDDVIDVSGVTVPATVLAEIRTYLSTAGATLSGQASDDQFLRHVQDNASTPKAFVHQVTGANNEFLVSVVLPDIQKSVAANPGPATADGKTFKFSGSVVENGTAQSPLDANCTPSTLTTTGNAGAIVNVTLDGDIQKAGTYTAKFASGSFHTVVKENGFTCVIVNAPPFVKPADSQVSTQDPAAGQATVTSDGTNLTVTGLLPPAAGCTGGDPLKGTVIGAANPMVSLSGSMTCNLGQTNFVYSMSIKLVGAI